MVRALARPASMLHRNRRSRYLDATAEDRPPSALGAFLKFLSAHEESTFTKYNSAVQGTRKPKSLVTLPTIVL